MLKFYCEVLNLLLKFQFNMRTMRNNFEMTYSFLKFFQEHNHPVGLHLKLQILLISGQQDDDQIKRSNYCYSFCYYCCWQYCHFYCHSIILLLYRDKDVDGDRGRKWGWLLILLSSDPNCYWKSIKQSSATWVSQYHCITSSITIVLCNRTRLNLYVTLSLVLTHIQLCNRFYEKAVLVNLSYGSRSAYLIAGCDKLLAWLIFVFLYLVL